MGSDEIAAPATALDNVKSVIDKVATVCAVGMSMFHLVSAGLGSFPTMQQRSVHLGFVLILIFLQKATAKKTGWFGTVLLSLCAVFSVMESVYVFFNYSAMGMFAATPTQFELILGGFTLVSVLACTLIKIGKAMPIIAGVFIVYALLGPYLPVMIAHRGYSIARIIAQNFMSTNGIYGTVLGTSATYIFLFILFGSMLEYSGAAKFFIDISLALFGKKRGGSAKVATVACCLFGMVSGSATANVSAIGPLTAPIMQKEGYSNRFGGAVLSVAGTGGQFMPPVMGAAAFLIAETLGIPYISVAKAALLPGILYYATLWFIINIRANKEALQPIPKEDIRDWRVVLKEGAYLSIPFVLLIFFLAVIRWSPIKAGFWSIISIFAISMVKKETRITPKKLALAFKNAAYSAITVAVVCALAGIIVSMLSMTGLGIKFSTLLVTLAHGNVIVLLVLTAIAGIIMGMGMGTTSIYIILSVLVAPALVKMNIPPLAAHLFVFYFGCLSGITPPVALASYAAAAIVHDEPMPLGFMAWKMSLAGYILPFMFAFNSALLLDGSFLSIIRCVITSSIGIFALGCSTEGFFASRLNMVQRAAVFAGALCLIDSGFLTDIIGVALVFGCLTPNYLANKKKLPVS